MKQIHQQTYDPEKEEFVFEFEYPDSVIGYCVRNIEPGRPYGLYAPDGTPMKINWYDKSGNFLGQDITSLKGSVAPDNAFYAGFVRWNE